MVNLFSFNQALSNAIPSNEEEHIMAFDLSNREKGKLLRYKPNPWWIRASYIFIQVSEYKTSEKKFLIQKRSMNKDYCPGCYILSTGGVFSPGESKLDNALRELEEETGLTLDEVEDRKQPSESFVDAGYMPYVDPMSRLHASLYVLKTSQ